MVLGEELIRRALTPVFTRLEYFNAENVLKIWSNMHNMTSPLKQGQGQPEDL